jgi:pimeloyl-ACP methyl ester carboxylesterase
LPRLLRKGYPVPIGFIGGDNSWETSQSGHQHTKALVGSHFRIVPGGHLFPMENPAAAAEATREMIDDLLSGQSGKKVLKKAAVA